MWKRVKNLKSIILNLLFPQFCLRCQKEGFLICPDCFSLIDISSKNYAQPGLNRLFAARSYKNPIVKKMITLFKYEPYIKNLAAPLSELIISYFALLEKKPSGIFIPVPITNKKIKKRGYNQSELIAEILSLYYHLPLSKNNLIKTKETKNQADLGKEQRKQNVSGSFSIKNPALITGKEFCLLDDVFTTGATMAQCAKVLKSAGAKKVYGIAIVREE